MCVDAALRLYGASQPAVGVSDPALHTYLTTGGAVPEGVMQGVRADSSVVSTLTGTWTTNTFAQITTWRCVRACMCVYVSVSRYCTYLQLHSWWVHWMLFFCLFHLAASPPSPSPPPRYFLSNRGLFAVFPGIQLPANYLPAESTW